MKKARNVLFTAVGSCMFTLGTILLMHGGFFVLGCFICVIGLFGLWQSHTPDDDRAVK